MKLDTSGSVLCVDCFIYLLLIICSYCKSIAFSDNDAAADTWRISAWVGASCVSSHRNPLRGKEGGNFLVFFLAFVFTSPRSPVLLVNEGSASGACGAVDEETP